MGRAIFMKLGPITPTQHQSAPLCAAEASFILQLFCFVHFVNRQTGVVSESAKSEDPRLRRRWHSKTLFCYNLFLFCANFFKLIVSVHVPV